MICFFVIPYCCVLWYSFLCLEMLLYIIKLSFLCYNTIFCFCNVVLQYYNISFIRYVMYFCML